MIDQNPNKSSETRRPVDIGAWVLAIGSVAFGLFTIHEVAFSNPQNYEGSLAVPIAVAIMIVGPIIAGTTSNR